MSVKRKRSYDSSGRRAAAKETRRAILDAATRLFASQGYASTTMAAIAAEAGVALDTVYAAVGRKPELFRLLIETAISGTERPVPAEDRDYVRAVRAESDAGRKIDLYAAAVATMGPRLAPILGVLRAASSAHPELAATWQAIANRRAANMRLFAADLAATGQLRVPIDEAADIVWAMNAPEFTALFVHDRGWSPERFGQWLAMAWRRLLLDEPTRAD